MDLYLRDVQEFFHFLDGCLAKLIRIIILIVDHFIINHYSMINRLVNKMSKIMKKFSSQFLRGQSDVFKTLL